MAGEELDCLDVSGQTDDLYSLFPVHDLDLSGQMDS